MDYETEFEDDGFADEGLKTLEHKRAHERIRADGVRVQVDLDEDTSLRRYVADRRTKALEALTSLASVDPTESLAIALLQHVVAEYLNVMDWARTEIEASHHADNELQRSHRDEAGD